jgi:hypothetical protein
MVQMESIMALAHRQSSDLEQERLQLRGATDERLSTSESEKASVPSSVSPVPSMDPTAPTTPSLVSGWFSTPETISRPLSIMSETLSLFQKYQCPHPNSQPPSTRQCYNGIASVRHDHYTVTGMSLFEQPESGSQILLKPPHPGRAISDIHDSPPSNAGVSLSSLPHSTKLRMAQEEEATEARRWREIRGSVPDQPFGSLGPNLPSAINWPSPGSESQGRTVSDNEREQRNAANQQWYSRESARAVEPPLSVTADHRSSGSAASACAQASATQTLPPSASPPIPNLSTKPSIASPQNLERNDRLTENTVSRCSGLLSATRPTGSVLKR